MRQIGGHCAPTPLDHIIWGSRSRAWTSCISPACTSSPRPVGVAHQGGIFTGVTSLVRYTPRESTLRADTVLLSKAPHPPVFPPPPPDPLPSSGAPLAPELTALPAQPKYNKNAKKKEKKKARKQAKGEKGVDGDDDMKDAAPTSSSNPGIEIEYVADSGLVDHADPLFDEWSKIFDHFQKAKPEKDEVGIHHHMRKIGVAHWGMPLSLTLPSYFPCDQAGNDVKEGDEQVTVKKAAPSKPADVDEDDEDGEGKSKEKLSRKKFKLLHRLSIAELKQLVKRPDVVEVWDVTSSDPRLLVYLKSYRNSVAVPRHWCNKRKYLQGKRGIEKLPFQLPSFIEATGIAKLRQAYEDKNAEQSAKQKARNQSRPKMSKMDIDYQVLHDAFFKFQTKPYLSKHGDLYFESKELEVKCKERRPGTISDELKTALGMPMEGVPVPPPWLINMQRYGPPPSYPNLKVQGLNAPIPVGASFGYHPGGWGKPPVDEFGRPIYGDVFGVAEVVDVDTADVDKKLWGEIEEVESESEEEEEAEEEADAAEMEAGISSVASGLETPATASGIESIELRKGSMGGTETPDTMGEFSLRKDQSLYKVIQQEDAKVEKGDIMGSSFKYNLNEAAGGGKRDKNAVNIIKNQSTSGVEVTIDASELEGMDAAMLAEKYQETMENQKASKEDVSDVFDEQTKKRKKQQQGKEAKSKKYKEYAWG